MDSEFQSTLPARGATYKMCCMLPAGRISIHAPRTGSDVRRQPLRRVLRISIHAPRTGSDQSALKRWKGARNFNPRSPHGERQVAALSDSLFGLFQSTLPARGATQFSIYFKFRKEFQSTLPARGATTVKATRQSTKLNFNPRSPHGERQIAR